MTMKQTKVTRMRMKTTTTMTKARDSALCPIQCSSQMIRGPSFPVYYAGLAEFFAASAAVDPVEDEMVDGFDVDEAAVKMQFWSIANPSTHVEKCGLIFVSSFSLFRIYIFLVLNLFVYVLLQKEIGTWCFGSLEQCSHSKNSLTGPFGKTSLKMTNVKFQTFFFKKKKLSLLPNSTIQKQP